jgi:hypothetical protein
MEKDKIVSPGRPRLKVSDETVAELKKLHDDGTSYRELERQFGISRRTITRLMKKLSN